MTATPSGGATQPLPIPQCGCEQASEWASNTTPMSWLSYKEGGHTQQDPCGMSMQQSCNACQCPPRKRAACIEAIFLKLPGESIMPNNGQQKSDNRACNIRLSYNRRVGPTPKIWPPSKPGQSQNPATLKTAETLKSCNLPGEAVRLLVRQKETANTLPTGTCDMNT